MKWSAWCRPATLCRFSSTSSSTRRPESSPRVVQAWLARLVLLIGACAYSWVAAGLRPFTAPIGVAVAAPELLVAGLSWFRSGTPGAGRGGPKERSESSRAGVAGWLGLVALLAGWELIAYVSSPRRSHPTLSSMADGLTSTHPGRAALFGLWLLLGWAVLVRRVRAGQ